ncbi:MAG: DUF3617 domain-containing protein [Pseudomonadota bacterium]|nr:DUF3617 domain-containing protein [Pseudomonadota bacterium]
MNIRVIAPALLSLVAIASAPATAQTMRPGLWEVKNNLGGSGDARMQEMAKAQKQQIAVMREQMAKMPPEQRQAMEAMMSRTGQMPTIDEDGMTIKVCVTPEMAAGNQLPVQHRGNCTSRHSAPVGGVMKISYACTNPAASGEGTVTYASDTAYTMTMTMNTGEGGSKHATSMSSRGKWLAASCGSIKPPPMQN